LFEARPAPLQITNHISCHQRADRLVSMRS
jgi:hypothetical protein